MGSLHCARICMDVIAALIGRRRGRPAPCLAPPALEAPLRAAPPPGTERRGHGGGAGPGSCGPRGRGGVPHAIDRRQGAGTWSACELGRVSARRWRSHRYRASHLEDRGLLSLGMRKDLAGVP